MKNVAETGKIYLFGESVDSVKTEIHEGEAAGSSQFKIYTVYKGGNRS